MGEEKRRFRSLSDSELVDLLYTAGDRLPREAVDEILLRKRRMLPRLAEIVVDKTSWTLAVPEWWAVVHATYILGAMGDRDALVPLLTALRWADAFDCDWVTEDLPSIFARFSPAAWGLLEAVARDVTAGEGARSIALAGLACLSLDSPHLKEEVLHFAAQTLSDEREGLYLRQTCANLLIDFCAVEHREPLLAFGRDESDRKRADPEYSACFYDWELDELLKGAEDGSALEDYRRDCLGFYDPEEIATRQERWAREQEEAEDEQHPGGSFPETDPSSPCPCGSGWPFDQCCYLKVH